MTEQPNADKMFTINETDYRLYIEPPVRQFIVPATVFQFRVHLPFYLPLPYGAVVSMESDLGICTFAFYDFQMQEAMLPSFPDAPTLEIKRSIVEMILTTESEYEISDNNDITDQFDSCIEKLNNIITAYAVRERDHKVYRVEKEMLDPICVSRIIPVDNWSKQHPVTFMLHFDFAYNRDLLSDEQIGTVVWYAHVVNANLNPFIRSIEVLLTTERYIADGFYIEAVIHAQIGIEQFLNTLYMWFLQFEGMNESDAEAQLEKIAFISMVKKEFHSRLGGYWDIAKSDTAIGDWYSNTYLLRNRIMHGGFTPKITETRQALDSATALVSYVISLIAKRRKKYAALVEYFAATQRANEKA